MKKWNQIDAYIGTIASKLMENGYTDISYDYNTDFDETYTPDNFLPRFCPSDHLERYRSSSITITCIRNVNNTIGFLKVVISKIYDEYAYIFENNYPEEKIKSDYFNPLDDKKAEDSISPIRVNISYSLSDSIINSETIITEDDSFSMDDNCFKIKRNNCLYNIFPLKSKSISSNIIRDIKTTPITYSEDSIDCEDYFSAPGYAEYKARLEEEQEEEIINEYGYDDPDMCLAVHRSIEAAYRGDFDEPSIDTKIQKAIESKTKSSNDKNELEKTTWKYCISLTKSFFIDCCNSTDFRKCKYDIISSIKNNDIINHFQLTCDTIFQFIKETIDEYNNCPKIFYNLCQESKETVQQNESFINLFAYCAEAAINGVFTDRWWNYFNPNWIEYVYRKINQLQDKTFPVSSEIFEEDDLPF